MKNNFSWIYFVSKRFSLVDRKGGSAVTTRLSSLGICFGVMTLIVVLSVMNGFQMQFIDSIIQLSSYHVQIVKENNDDYSDYLKTDNNVVSFVDFKEAQALMTNKDGKESAALIRAVPENVLSLDSGFAKEMDMISGDFDLSSGKDDSEDVDYSGDGIVLGSRLAKALGVKKGSRVNLFALSGSSDTALISNNRTFIVRGIFSCGYADINAGYAFISLSAADKYFGSVPLITGVKLKNQSADRHFQKEFNSVYPDVKTTAWRDYNRSFFGALRVEKNMLFLLIVMIFIVVAINIYNSMRKLVFERRVEISTLSSLGADNKSIQNVFIFRSLMIGIKGAVPGLILGLILSFNIKNVFIFLAKVEWFFTYLTVCIFNPAAKSFVRENSMWYVYAHIPARIIPGEVVFITLFGICSCLIAAMIASRNVLNMKISEVLHEE